MGYKITVAILTSAFPASFTLKFRLLFSYVVKTEKFSFYREFDLKYTSIKQAKKYLCDSLTFAFAESGGESRGLPTGRWV